MIYIEISGAVRSGRSTYVKRPGRLFPCCSNARSLLKKTHLCKRFVPAETVGSANSGEVSRTWKCSPTSNLASLSGKIDTIYILHKFLSTVVMDPYYLYPPFPDPDSFFVVRIQLVVFILSDLPLIQPEENTVKLHAPIPVQGQFPLLYSDLDSYPQMEEHDFSSSTRALEEVPLNPMYCPEGQPTFPTPSELMADLASRGNSSSSLDEFASDMHSEPARKARRRAMAQSVGFVPTDPFVFLLFFFFF